MKAKLILAIILLVLVSFAHSISESDFVRVKDGNSTYFTHKDIANANMVLGVDKVFYGSNTGEVLIHLFLKDKTGLAMGKYKVGLQTKTGKTIAIKEVGGDTKAGTGSASNVLIKADFDVSNKISEYSFTVTFDPAEILYAEEFDIILYDSLGHEVARLDPWLSGFSNRKQILLDTTQLSADVTNDHTILVFVSPSNTIWDIVTGADWNGITFTKEDGTTQLDFYVEKFSQTDKNAWFWVEITDTFPSAYDYNGYIYYDGPNTDYSDGTGAFPADYNAFYMMNSTAGTTLVDVTGHSNGTVTDATKWRTQAKIDGAYDCAGTANGSANTGGPPGPSDSFTMLASVMSTNLAAGDIMEFSGMRLYRRTSGACIYTFNFEDSVGGELCGGTQPLTENQWYNVAARYNSATTGRTISVNGTDQNSANYDFAITANTFYIGRYSEAASSYWPGLIDNVRYFNRLLSADEIKLLHLSDSNALVYFGSVEESGVNSVFTYSSSPAYLDPENGVNSLVVTLTDASTYTGAYSYNSSKWYDNNVLFTTDQNTTRTYTSTGDHNICLDINAISAGPLYATSVSCQTISVLQAAQSLGISYDINAFSANDVNVLFKGTATGTVDNWYWQYDGSYFGDDQNSQYIFTAGDSDANICVTAKISDTNKIYCKNYYVSRLIVKIPKKESDGVTNITPYGLTANSVPPQTYSALTNDANIFNFSNSISNYALTVDANDSLYFDRIYSFSTGTANYTLQPYLADATTGTSVKIVTQSSVDYSTIGNVTISIYKNIPVVGRVLIESVITDDKGEAYTSGVVNNEYEYEVYYQGSLVKTFDITITSTTIYILFNPSVSSTLPSGVIATVAFDPAYSGLWDLNAQTQFKQIFTWQGATATSIQIWVKQYDVNGIIPDANLYSTYITAALVSPYTNTITKGTNLSGWDENQTVRVYAQVCFSDGNCYLRLQNYHSPNYSVAGDTWKLLTKGVWTSLGCSGDVCPFLLLIALIVSISVTAYLAVTNPLPEVGNHLGIVFILVLGIFVVINWVHWALWFVAALATFLISTVSREAIK